MRLLYGIYLLATLGCTYYVLHKYFYKEWRPKEGSSSSSKILWAERKAKVVAFMIVLVAWWLQDAYRHKYSSEAIAMKTINALLDQWEAGEKNKVIKELDYLSISVRPWDSEDNWDEEW